MWEYSSVSRSSYDPDALVAALNEQAAEGWEVVAIVPRTDGQLTGFLRREGGAGAEAAPAAETELAVTAPEVLDTEPAVVAAAITDPEPEPEPEATSPWSPTPVEAGAAGAAAGAAGSQWSPTPDPTPEPAGWASAPETTAPIAPIETPAPAPAPTPPVSQPATPANWYPDPSGRFELRYWNGTAWTEHVSRGGVQYTDPPTA